MKRIVIGRANDSDIVIPDEHDNVSRHHAVISFDFFGRMTLSDTSSNGTLINGTRMLKGASVPVTRNDKIQLGGAWMFDWSLVEDPYRKVRIITYILIALLVFISIGVVSWSIYNSRHNDTSNSITVPKAPDATNEGDWNSDSTKSVAPTETSISTPQMRKKSEKKADRSKKTSNKRVSNSKNGHKEATKSPEDNTSKKDFSSEKNMPVVN